MTVLHNNCGHSDRLNEKMREGGREGRREGKRAREEREGGKWGRSKDSESERGAEVESM